MREGIIMKMCIPTINAEEQFSEVCDNFGSAPYFTIYDFEADTYETVNNSELKVSLKVSSNR